MPERPDETEDEKWERELQEAAARAVQNMLARQRARDRQAAIDALNRLAAEDAADDADDADRA